MLTSAFSNVGQDQGPHRADCFNQEVSVNELIVTWPFQHSSKGAPPDRGSDRAGRPSDPSRQRATSIPTMSTAELRLGQEEPSRDPSKDLWRGGSCAFRKRSPWPNAPGPPNPHPKLVSSTAAAPTQPPNHAHLQRRQPTYRYSSNAALNRLCRSAGQFFDSLNLGARQVPANVDQSIDDKLARI